MTKIHRQQYGWLAVISSFAIAVAASGQSPGSQVSVEVALPRQEGAGRSLVNRTANAHVVISWNTAALNAIRARRTSPPIASRGLAILHVAIYDATNGIDRTHEPYLAQSTVAASASEEAAASAAAHRVLVALFPANAASFDDLQATILSAVPNGPLKSAGIAWGESVADEILAQRANDGSTLLPQWAFVTPFAMTNSAQFRPPGPPALTSKKYAADYSEVKIMGAAVGSAGSSEQDLIALFWADGAGTETPPGRWNSIARVIAAARGNTLAETARLFALLNIAMADAAICAWDAKYTYNFWRPVTAIRNGDADGNAATIADPTWNSFIVTPPFPDYISGHSTFSGAASTVLARFYGTDNIAFTAGSDFLPGVTRSFTSFSAAAGEAALSRLYGGIHFRSANEDGLVAGIHIGEFTFVHYLQPKGNRSRK